MAAASERINVFRPRTLADLLSLKRRKPDVSLFAGGTYILQNDTGKYPELLPAIASIRHLDELKRIHRTERYIELGCCVSLAEINRIGGETIPDVLIQAIRSIGSPPVRSLATIGGNICARDKRLTLFPVLLLLDTRVELREHGGSRWASLTRLVDAEGNLHISETEILTRLRIPLVDWNYQYHRRLSAGPVSDRWSLSFCGIASTNRGILTDFRCIFGSMGKVLLRNREIEAELVSRKVPLLERDLSAIYRDFEAYVKESAPSMLSPFQVGMAGKMIRWFLASLGA
ncbi:MAG: FAD binding domain-containing protein [Spirochaetales bacterium]|nr:FAD binding domain-containing protein [Spirochaetales bacterium]